MKLTARAESIFLRVVDGAMRQGRRPGREVERGDKKPSEYGLTKGLPQVMPVSSQNVISAFVNADK